VEGSRWLEGRDDGQLALHDPETGERLRTFTPPVGAITACALDAGGRIGVAATADGDVVVADLQWGDMDVRQVPYPVTACACAADARHVLTVAADAEAMLWQVQHGQARIVSRREAKLQDARLAAVSHDGRHGVAAGGTRFEVWDFEREGPARVVDLEQPIDACALSPNGQFVVLGLRSGRIVIWDAIGWRTLRELDSSDGPTAMSFTPDGGSVLVGHSSGSVLFARILAL
jgi:WD40 repeat protein